MCGEEMTTRQGGRGKGGKVGVGLGEGGGGRGARVGARVIDQMFMALKGVGIAGRQGR